MQARATRNGPSRRVLVLLALGATVLLGIGIASAATADHHTRPTVAHPLGLVAPLGGRHHAGAHRASARVSAQVKLAPRTLKARVMASALQDPTVAVGTQPTGVALKGTDGPGIFPIVRGSSSTMIAKVLNNTVAAPITTSSARAGIRVDSGSSVGNTR